MSVSAQTCTCDWGGADAGGRVAAQAWRAAVRKAHRDAWGLEL